MDLPKEVTDTLATLAAASVPSDVFKAIVDAAFASLLESAGKVVEDPGPGLLGNAAAAKIGGAAVKAAFAAVVTLLVELAKTDQSSDAVSGFLEENGFDADRIGFFTKEFEDHRAQLRVLLRRTGFGLPHVTDVDWKLDYYMKSNQLEKINEPQFTLQFATEDNAGARDNVQMSCTLAQMQDLVSKLKDASKRLELMKEAN